VAKESLRLVQIQGKTAGDQIVAEVEASIEASVSLERDLHSYLASRVSEIESGLPLVENGVEYRTEAGRIDLLAGDAKNHLVVVELKAGKAKDNALGQLLGTSVVYRLLKQTCEGSLTLIREWSLRRKVCPTSSWCAISFLLVLRKYLESTGFRACLTRSQLSSRIDKNNAQIRLLAIAPQ
jgi:hypothetical protein